MLTPHRERLREQVNKLSLLKAERLLDRLEPKVEPNELADDGKETAEERTLVAEVRTWIDGRLLHLIGGIKKEPTVRAIAERLGCQVKCTPCERNQKYSRRRVQGLVRQTGDGIVLRLRWRSHGLEDLVKDECKKQSVHYVPLDRGYNVVQIARAIKDAIKDLSLS